MKNSLPILLLIIFITGCTSTKNLSYLSNLPETTEPQYFPYDMPDYKIQYRDIIYIDIKIQNSEGRIENILQGANSVSQSISQNEANQYLIGYNVDEDGNVVLPTIGPISVEGLTLKQIRELLQEKVDNIFRDAFIDVKLLSFKYTVLGEVRTPGTYINYNNYLTILEAVGRAGGVGDYGRRDRVVVVRPTKGGSQTYVVNLQDKMLLGSPAYFLMPNDVVIIEPFKHKAFSLNLPTISLIVSGVTSVLTSTLLLINYFSK